MTLYELLKPLIFKLDPEEAHRLSVQAMQIAGAVPPLYRALSRLFDSGVMRPVETLGLRFAHPVGLAAGYDKDGLAWRGLTALGFGHIEVGTITRQAQAGNPTPRVFRLVEDRAVINRLGFPGHGEDAVAKRLRGARESGCIIGANLGKNKDTPNATAYRDYVELVHRFAPLAHYLVVNVSSPNTVGLRRLQAKDALEHLLGHLSSARDDVAESLGRPVPLLLKLAPDLDDGELDDALDALLSAGLDGVIATNTTLDREGLKSAHIGEAGGLSGAPLEAMSTAMIGKIAERTRGELPIIGVGGVFTADDVQRKLDAGATLVQLYTGMIYEGPGIVKRILRGLA